RAAALVVVVYPRVVTAGKRFPRRPATPRRCLPWRVGTLAEVGRRASARAEARRAHPGRGNAPGAPWNHARVVPGRGALRAVRRSRSARCRHRRHLAVAEPGTAALRTAAWLGPCDRHWGRPGHAAPHCRGGDERAGRGPPAPPLGVG